MREMIICSAVRYRKKIWFGHRHHHALDAMKGELSYTMNRQQMAECGISNDQGFITSKNRYVSRQEAWDIAKKANQLKAKKVLEIKNKKMPKILIKLYSEDIY